MAITVKDAYAAMLKDYPDILDINELSNALGISTKTGYKLLREGKIVACKVGRSYRVPKLHVLAYLRVIGNSAGKDQ